MSRFKYVIYVTSTLESSSAGRIDGGCHIGEGRWERNVLDSFVRSGRDTYVTDLNRFWKSGVPIPENLHDYSSVGGISNLIFLGFSPAMRLDIPVKAKYYILNWFNGPDDDWHRRSELGLPKDHNEGELPDAATSFRNFESKNPNSVVATYNFPLRGEQYEKGFGKENTFLVQGPSVPQVFRGSRNFDKEYLLWGSKILWAWAENTSIHPFLSSVFKWCSDVMTKNENLKIRFLLGTAGPLRTTEDVANWFWGLPFSKSLFVHKNRVEFLYSMEWFEVFNILRDTKLIVSPHLGYGGPPYEAAAFGIPIILTSNGHPFMDRNRNSLFDGVLSVYEHYDWTEFGPVLDRLFNDRLFYEKSGSAYMDYVDKYATYDAYLRQIDEICEKRGW